MSYSNVHNGHAGDVQCFSIVKLPSTAKKITQQPLALGESHNHAHIVTGDCELFIDDENIFYVKTGAGKSLLQHTFESMIKSDTYNSQEPVEIADHLPCELMPDTIYQIGIHRKYNPFQKIWEKVVD